MCTVKKADKHGEEELKLLIQKLTLVHRLWKYLDRLVLVLGATSNKISLMCVYVLTTK